MLASAPRPWRLRFFKFVDGEDRFAHNAGQYAALRIATKFVSDRTKLDVMDAASLEC